MSDELYFLTVAEASRLIKARKLSQVELTDAYLTRIQTLQPQLNAFMTAWVTSSERDATDSLTRPIQPIRSPSLRSASSAGRTSISASRQRREPV